MNGVTLWSFNENFNGRFETFGLGQHDLTALDHFRCENIKAITVYTGYRARVFEGLTKQTSTAAVGKQATFGPGHHDLETLKQNGKKNNSMTSLVVEEDACITVYDKGWFDGKSENIGFGGKDTEMWQHIGKDAVKSFKVHQGYMVNFFEHPNFKGNLALLGPGSYNIDALKRLKLLNKSLSGIIVQGHGVTMFEHDNFKGRFQPFGVGKHDLESFEFKFVRNVANNRLGSLKVQRGYRITLYQSSGFRGRSITLLHGDYDCAKLDIMGYGSATLSSVIVESEFNRMQIDTLIQNNF